MKLKTSRILILSVLGIAILAIGAVACSSDDEDEVIEIPNVSITANDYNFDAPTSIVGGLTRISLTNGSPLEDHQAQLLRLKDDVSFADFEAAAADAETEADFLDFVEAAYGARKKSKYSVVGNP